MKRQIDLAHLSMHERELLNDFLVKLQQNFDDEILCVLLFGSRARGDATSELDFDLVVLVNQDDLDLRRAIRYLAAEISLEYGQYISTRVWSLAHWNRLKALQTGLYRNIEQEGIVLSSAQAELF